jgi:hypothetical protein
LALWLRMNLETQTVGLTMVTDIGVVIAILREVGYDTHDHESCQTLEVELQQFVVLAAGIN